MYQGQSHCHTLKQLQVGQQLARLKATKLQGWNHRWVQSVRLALFLNPWAIAQSSLLRQWPSACLCLERSAAVMTTAAVAMTQSNPSWSSLQFEGTEQPQAAEPRFWGAWSSPS